MEFGLVLSQFNARFEHLIGDAVAAEQAGLDSVWLADHLLGTLSPDAPVHEAWTALAYVAAVTDRVRLGHLVNCVSYRNVGLLAKMAATVDHASAGRLDLGLGAGWYEREYDAFGYTFGSAGVRRRYFEEYLDALIALFGGGPVDMDGEFIKLDQAICSPGPIQNPHPPIVIGTGGEMMRRVAGARADVWNCPTGLIPDLEAARRVVDEAADGRRCGRRCRSRLPSAETPKRRRRRWRSAGSICHGWATSKSTGSSARSTRRPTRLRTTETGVSMG